MAQGKGDQKKQNIKTENTNRNQDTNQNDAKKNITPERREKFHPHGGQHGGHGPNPNMNPVGGRGKHFVGNAKGDGHKNKGQAHSLNDREAQQQYQLEKNLPPEGEKKFSGRCRLYVGNISNDTTEEEFQELFKPFGENTEAFVSASRGFGFIRLDTRHNAEKAKTALDGKNVKGRMLRIRFAAHGAALKVKYLPPSVSNEILAQAFAQFGELEKAIVIADDRGRSTGEGIVEYARKPGAVAALRRVNEGVFLLASSPRPITVEPLDQKDDIDGLPEKFITKTGDFQKEREHPPRLAQPGTFEYEFGLKWKELYVKRAEEEENLKRQFEEECAKLEIDMTSGLMEHQTNLMRQDLMRRQEELRRLEEQHQIEIQRRLEMRRQEEERRQGESDRRRQEMAMRQEEQRRQQELFQQQERAMREMRSERNAPPMPPPPAPPAALGLERGNRQSNPNMGGQGSNGMGGSGGMSGLMNQNNMGSSSPNMSNQPMRQSRFDQPPNYQGGMGSGGGGGGGAGNMGGGMGNMGGGHGGNMGGHGGNMGGSGSQIGSSSPMNRGQRERQGREEFNNSFESKRARRF